MKFYCFLVLFFGLFFTNSHAQLTPFTLTAVATNETCLGNGTITSSVSGTTAGSSITYNIFKLPNTTVPVSGLAVSIGLQAGDYRVVATQILGAVSNQASQNVSIINQITPVVFSLSDNPAANCSTTGGIVVNVTSGNPVAYQIVAGPITTAYQISNVFTGLPTGTYTIRVKDGCNATEDKVRNLVLSAASISVSDVSFPANAISCTASVAMNTVTPSAGSLSYPLTAVFTIYQPNGLVVTSTQNIASGLPDQNVLSLPVTLYINQPYTYDVTVTDNCGRIFSKTLNVVDSKPVVGLTDTKDLCDNKTLNVLVGNFTPPYDIVFITAPAGFVPGNFNLANLGPFANSTVSYGMVNATVPNGFYQVQITDACSRTAISSSYEIKIEPKIASFYGSNNGCSDPNFGVLSVKVPSPHHIVSATILSGPPAYTTAVPTDVTNYIDNLIYGGLRVTNLPLGFYNLTVTDECGNIYPVNNLKIPVFQPAPLNGFNVSTLPSCTFGLGTIFLYSINGKLSNVQMTDAPFDYKLTHTMPFNVTSELDYRNKLFLVDLPPGNYTFTATDVCYTQQNITVTVVGYDRTSNAFTINRNCGTYEITMNDTSNTATNSAPKYWLLKQFPGGWGHPLTGVLYTDIAIPPTTTNAEELQNMFTKINISYVGKFKIIKSFITYLPGPLGTTVNKSLKNCVEELDDFEFTGDLSIIGGYSLDCAGGSGSSSILIDVLGSPPYNFSIDQKDGNPFIFNNGNNNVFTNLASGLYRFLVTDACKTLPIFLNVGSLPKLVSANQTIPNTLVCKAAAQNTDIFDLTSQNTTILSGQDPTIYTISYYLTQNDADTGSNKITNPTQFSNTQNPQPIFVRVDHNYIGLCHDTTKFLLIVGHEPILAAPNQSTICDGSSQNLSVDPGFSSYKWSTGETTSTITVTTPGTYTVKIQNIYPGGLFCQTDQSFTVAASGLAKIEEIIVQDWTTDTNSIEVKFSGPGTYTFSLDGVNYQSSNVFNNLKPDLYRVYVKDLYCGIIFKDQVLLNYDKYFTPNNDGENDLWRIKFSNFEQGIWVQIYDRFGKLLSKMYSNTIGWDGIYNSFPLPADDYWFVVYRKDGKILKGSFTLVR